MKGIYTAMVTPFDAHGHLDVEGLNRNIHHQIDANIDGLVILGTTGESPTLSHHEKEEIIRITVKAAKGKIPVIVGTGCYSTQQTIENTQLAEKLGAQGAMLVTPYYNKPTQEGLYRHFKAVAESTCLPILLYNIQGRTGQNIQTETLKRLAGIRSIVGVKEASGNVNQMMEVIECMLQERPDFKVLSGDDNLTLPLIALGGHGVVSVVSNLVPELVEELVHAALRGDFAKAREVHYRLLPLFRSAFVETNPIPIKAAMSMCGKAAGPCRLPLCELVAGNKQGLQQVLAEMQLLAG